MRWRGPAAPDSWRDRARRRWRTLLAVVLVGLALFAIVSDRWFVHPRVDDPGTADAIFVLAGGGNRVDHAVDLVRDGVATEVLFASVYVEEQGVWAAAPCNARRPERVPDEAVFRCAEPAPGTTRGEARLLRDEALAEGWETVVVVASTDQVTRARRLIARCWDGEVRLTGVPHDQPWPLRVAYEWAAGLKATLLRGC